MKTVDKKSKLKMTTTKPVRVRRVIEVTHFIRDWRAKRRMTVEALAEAAGISASMISQLERGRTSYTQATLEKIAAALKCQPWQLLASGPDENQRLWEHALLAAAPDVDTGMVPVFYMDAFTEFVQNSVDASVTFSRRTRLLPPL